MAMEHYIYTKLSEADVAYQIKKGTIKYQITPTDSFEIQEEDIIIGTQEIILSREDKFAYYRAFSVMALANCEYERIEKDKLFELIKEYKSGFSITRTIAETLLKINEILTRKNEEVGEKERVTREYCKIYAYAVDRLEEAFKKKRYPWLEPLYLKAKTSLTYAKGKAFSTFDTKPKLQVEEEKLEGLNKVFSAGSCICKQGDLGKEMYILVRGKLKVIINDNPISVIEEPGSVIGEMALLLGEHRTATLTATEETVLSVIKQEDLQAVAEQDPNFLYNIAVTLSRRVINNTLLINDLNDIIEYNKKMDASLPSVLREDKYRDDLKELQKSIKALEEKYQMEWLYDIFVEISDRALKVKSKKSVNQE